MLPDLANKDTECPIIFEFTTIKNVTMSLSYVIFVTYLYEINY
jgi:hypothetical protein